MFICILVVLSVANISHDLLFSHLSKIFTVIVAISCAIGIFQLTQINLAFDTIHQSLYAVQSIYGHKNLFAEILALLFPFVAYTAFSEHKQWKLLGTLTAVLATAFIILLVSRTVWIAFLLSITFSLVLYATFNWKNKKRKHNVKKIGTSIIATIGVGIVLFSIFGYGDLLYKQVYNFINVRYGSALDRFFLWQKTFSVFDSGWFFGRGLESWKIDMLSAGAKGLKSMDETTFYQRPHNDYIWILFEQGIAGLLCFLSMFCCLAYSLLKDMQKYPDLLRPYILFAVFVSFGIVSLFAFPKERIEHTIILAIVFFLSTQNQKKSTAILPAFALFAVLGMSAFGIFVGMSRFNSEKNLKQALAYRNAGNWMKTIEYADKAYSSFFKIDMTSTPVDWYRGEAWYYMNRLDKALIFFDHAYSLNPYHIHNTNNLATCYYKSGELDKAIPLYKQALSINPSFSESLFNLSSVMFNNKRYEEGYKYFRSIPDTINPQRYKKIARAYIPIILDYELSHAKNSFIKDQIIRVINSQKWAYVIHKKSVENNISYHKQLYLDLAYILSSDSTITKQEKKEIELIGSNTISIRY